MGSTLDRPTMLMNKNFIQETQTLSEDLKGGDKFKRQDMGMAPPSYENL